MPVTKLTDYFGPFDANEDVYYSEPRMIVYKTEETLDCEEVFPQKLCVVGHTSEGLKVVTTGIEEDEVTTISVFTISEEHLASLYQAPGKLMISFDSSSPSPNSRVKPGSPAHLAAFGKATGVCPCCDDDDSSLSPIKKFTTSSFDQEF